MGDLTEMGKQNILKPIPIAYHASVCQATR